ncbi:MAG: RNA polymerase sigma factor [Spirochaetales bacterium]|nr:RNA polymerase sigma factor [Spirochaetales bacterium]
MEADELTEEQPCAGIAERAKSAGEHAIGEKQLIRELIAFRDPVLFERLLPAHLPWLRRLLYSVFNGAREDMEDAEQEILTGIYSDVGRYRFQSSFKTFFYRYARNKAIDLLRKTVRLRRREAALKGEIPLAVASPEEEFLKRDRREELSNRLLELAADERDILLMKDVEGFSIDEISAVTGRKAGTVKSILHRTREKLFALIEGRRRICRT